MRRRHRPDPEDEEEDADEEEETETDGRPRGRPVPRTVGDPRHRRPIRPWSPDEEAPQELGWFGRPKKPVYWRARDSLWFEPVVAIMVVIVLLVGLWAYTNNWPPVYVVESSSMQHGPNDVLGLLNTGDLLLAQKIDPARIVPYEVGAQTGYTTYGEFGDVILYYPDGATAVSPIIHRAILYLQWNPGPRNFNATQLSSLTCSPTDHPYYESWSTLGGCGTIGLSGNLSLYGIGWRSANLTISLASIGQHSGFLTMGDGNLQIGTSVTGEPDQPTLSSLVETGWIIGVARGMLPWFGSLKLLLQGDASMVPAQSWQYLGATLAAFVLGGLGLHVALRRLEERREQEEDDAAEQLEQSELAVHRGLLERLLHRSHREQEGSEEIDEEEAEQRPRHRRRVRIDARRLGRGGGRPRPKTRRERSAPRSHPHQPSSHRANSHPSRNEE